MKLKKKINEAPTPEKKKSMEQKYNNCKESSETVC